MDMTAQQGATYGKLLLLVCKCKIHGFHCKLAIAECKILILEKKQWLKG